jgi:hypothetical protein
MAVELLDAHALQRRQQLRVQLARRIAQHAGPAPFACL